ncbi:GNAT family N-acetyltransferase [Vibrio sp. SM6]|uniref:GNAT family N-acetyltransferase n=1 Tax=Vibrio agarilyticus TaxID=2726741 RepID=A0A7X8TPS7_9VIBR|nr:GNAT family N-acetyltransferase [Vibrio agarilyticus]NLS12633.1 GNAT family N-acetyltransferase [Vibrio agarilyticus]
MQELTHQVEVGEIAWQHTLALRHQVLEPEQNETDCHIDGDENSVHFGAFLDDRLIGIASVFVEDDQARLRYMATHPDFQSRGVAKALFNYVATELKFKAVTLLWCDSQKTNSRFYRQLGFRKLGESFLKNNVAYYKLCMILGKSILR